MMLRPCRRMGRLAPILTLCAAIACGYYIFVQDAIEEAGSRTITSGPEAAARRAASAGYVRGAELLHESFADTSFSGSYAQDSFRVNIDIIGNRAVVSSLGLSQSDSTVVDHIVRVEYERTRQAPVKRPYFLRTALYAGRDIIVEDSVVFSAVRPEHESTLIAHVEGSVRSNPGLFDLSIVRSAVPVTPADSSIYDAPALIQSLYGPDVRLASHSSTGGDLILHGPIGDGASPRSPFVWHVEGDLIISEDVVSKGYVLLLVDGNVIISGNVTSDSRFHDGSESSLAIHAEGSIVVVEPVTVAAQLFAGGEILVGEGGASIVGSVSARQNVVVRGPTRIHFQPSSRSLVLNWANPVENITLLSFDEQ